MTTPCSRKISATTDFPVPMPPVKPITYMRPTSCRSLCHSGLDGWGRAVPGWWRGISVLGKPNRRPCSLLNLLRKVKRLAHPLRQVEPVSIRSTGAGTQLEMRAPALPRPISCRLQELTADPPAPLACRHHQVLEPAARSVPT